MSAVRVISRSGTRNLCRVAQNSVTITMSRRSLHVSTVSQDFFSWFKDRKKKKVKSTKEVINELESGKDVSQSNEAATTLDLTPNNFIGTFDKKRNVIPLETVPFNNWFNQNKIISEEEFDTVLLEAYNETFKTGVKNVTDNKFTESFNDIIQKFKFAKLLQAKTGYLLSDYQFTRLNSPMSFKNYYLKEFISGKSLRYKESEPNAIHLNQLSFKAPNINVIEDIPAKVKRRNFKKIIDEVDAIENRITKDAIESAKQT